MIYVKNFAIEEVEESAEKVSEVCNVNLKEFATQTSRKRDDEFKEIRLMNQKIQMIPL